MVTGTDGVETNDFTGQVKAGDLLFTAGQGGIGLDGARANRIDRLEGLTLVIQVVAALKWPVPLDNVVELIQMAILNSSGQANWVQGAFGAIGLAQCANDDGRGMRRAIRHGLLNDSAAAGGFMIAEQTTFLAITKGLRRSGGFDDLSCADVVASAG